MSELEKLANTWVDNNTLGTRSSYVNAFIAGHEAAIKDLEARNKELEERVLKLKRLILLTDESVSNVAMNDLSAKQWEEYCRYENERKVR